MDIQILGGKSFSFLKVTLPPNKSITTEAGAMASMDKDIDLSTRFNGGFFNALILKIFGKETIFINTLKNTSNREQTLYLTQPTPGEIVQVDLKGEDLYIQPGSYVASTPGITFGLRWAGFSSWLAREGLFRIQISGRGTVWYGAFGAVVEKEVNGEYIVDSGHLLSYPPNMQLQIKLSGGIFSSFFGGEGLVLKLIGKGKIKIQTRSIGGLAGWLNPRFWS